MRAAMTTASISDFMIPTPEIVFAALEDLLSSAASEESLGAR
jgi:hypothetical protein